MAIVSQQIRTDKYGRKGPPSPSEAVLDVIG